MGKNKKNIYQQQLTPMSGCKKMWWFFYFTVGKTHLLVLKFTDSLVRIYILAKVTKSDFFIFSAIVFSIGI